MNYPSLSLGSLSFALYSVVLCILKSAVTLFFFKVKNLIHCETLNWTTFVV